MTLKPMATTPHSLPSTTATEHPTKSNTMNEEIITSGNRAVVITSQEGAVSAVLYVNAREGIQNADITLLRWSGKTVAGAKRWAARQFQP